MDELYNSKNPLVKFVHNDRLNKIVIEIPNKKRLKILDAGCGEGHLIEKLNLKNNTNFYYGVDITEMSLESAKKRCPYAQLYNMNLLNLDFDDESLDIVICSEVLEHVFEYETVLKELNRVLKKNGNFIITFPNETLWTISRIILGRRPIKVPDHINSFTPQKMLSLIKMKPISVVNLPFGLHFILSLGCLIKFKK